MVCSNSISGVMGFDWEVWELTEAAFFVYGIIGEWVINLHQTLVNSKAPPF